MKCVGRTAKRRWREQKRVILSRRAEQVDALAHVTGGRDLSVVVGHAGTGKSAMLGVAREAWQAAGYEVKGVALSGMAAENLESGSGIASRTIASMEHGWGQGRDLLTSPRRAGDRRGGHGRHAPAGARLVPCCRSRREGRAGRRSRSSCKPSRPARRSGRSMSITAGRKSARCAVSGRTGSARRHAIWRRAKPAMRWRPIAPKAWCTRPKPASRRAAI